VVVTLKLDGITPLRKFQGNSTQRASFARFPRIDGKQGRDARGR
jgi:hypothetical protein